MSVKLTIRLSDEQYGIIKTVSKQTGKTKSEITRDFLNTGINTIIFKTPIRDFWNHYNNTK